MKFRGLLVLLVFLPGVSAVTFTEDFEDFSLGGFDPDTKPSQDWYAYTESSDWGNVDDGSGVIEGTQSMFMQSGTDGGKDSARFTLTTANQLTSVNFTIDLATITDNGVGSRNIIALESTGPVRKVVEFYVFCNDVAEPGGCDFRVKFDHLDTTGQSLLNATLGLDEFTVLVVFDWNNLEYDLFVNGIDDGTFPFLEIPSNFGRLTFSQYASSIEGNITFDSWEIIGAAEPTDAGDLDIGTSIQNTANNLGFTNAASLFMFGLVVFLGLIFSVLFALKGVGLSRTISSGGLFFVLLTGLFMVDLEFWPNWVAIGAIILTAALIGTLVRRLALGIRDASSGPALVAGSLGYFIIATTLLAFSGYATDTIAVPREPADQTTTNETTNPDQGFIEATTECIVTGFTALFGGDLDCSRKTESVTWGQITDVFGWVRTGLNFLFQLLTFQLPIPAIFSAMIVLPPAAALGTYAIAVIRGSGT